MIGRSGIVSCATHTHTHTLYKDTLAELEYTIVLTAFTGTSAKKKVPLRCSKLSRSWQMS